MSAVHPGASKQLLRPIFNLPESTKIGELIGKAGITNLIAEADEIQNSNICLFGGKPFTLKFTLRDSLQHWTNYETHPIEFPEGDIKFIWEPARFGWAFILARAYHLTQDERYPETFWRFFDQFHQSNPGYLGPNWVSAQEVALRILPFVFCGQVFADSPHSTEPRKNLLASSVALHAKRILPTLIYARAQNNNHLLSEAAGLITAALGLPNHPKAINWERTGWKWFNKGLETQISSKGAYIQHSTNYHRLMLQLALWIYALQCTQESGYLKESKSIQTHTSDGHLSSHSLLNLGKATGWLKKLVDKNSGRVPNLGHNDGAYVLPLTVLPYDDFRPVVQTASKSFLGMSGFEPGLWDEMGLWLGDLCALESKLQLTDSDPMEPNTDPATLRHPNGKSWIYLRAANITDRPGHADQLHVDLWWRGLNIAKDAGTYLYNENPPWDNSLTHTAVHNTVMVDGMEQMSRAGRFLYLDRAQGKILTHEQSTNDFGGRIVARHDGYSRLGISHNRSITATLDGRWVVEDSIEKGKNYQEKRSHIIRLHWLLPDWRMIRLEESTGVRINSPFGWINLNITVLGADRIPPDDLQSVIVRAGERIHGKGSISPTWGWVSPTYGIKQPALSFSIHYEGSLPITFVSEWRFPED
jgi:hypothetical protein